MSSQNKPDALNRRPEPRKKGPVSPFVPSGFFALRTPLRPIDTFLRWSEGLQAPEAIRQKDRLARDRQALEAAIDADRQALRQGLRDLLADPVIREAVFVASPDLAEAIEIWEQEPGSAKGLRAEESLVRYLTRFSYRCTPFGLFAGCSVGHLGEESHLELAAESGYRRHVRLDMHYLTSLTGGLGQQDSVRREVQYRPNPSLYRLGNQYRYAEGQEAEGALAHHLVALTSSPHLQATLEFAAEGRSLAELAQHLVQVTGAPEADAEAFLTQLIDSQALVPDLTPTITGPEPTAGLIQTLEQHTASSAAAQGLRSALDRLEAADNEPLGLDPERYREVGQDLDGLPAEVNLSRLFQVDMYKPVSQATLSQDVFDNLLQGVSVLQVMAQRTQRNELFRHFINEFTKRYETQEIPLVEALDEEHGIGFSKSMAPGAEPSPLLEDVRFATQDSDRTFWGARERILLQLLMDAQAKDQQEVQLSSAIVGTLARHATEPLPDAFSVMAVLGAESDEALKEGKYKLHVSGCSGPSGANLLGRFCHGDSELLEQVRQHVQAEQDLDEEAVFAEIVHLPEGRIGNILLRPVLRPYDIPLLGGSAQPREQQIPITDLMISVRQGRIVLRSKRLGKRIHPRLTTAHGYFSDRNLGIYKFLCSLQWQGTMGGTSWSWAPFDSAAFLPRVVFRDLVLERATWRISQHEIRKAAEGDGGARFREMQKLRENRRLPRHFVLADRDNELLVDLDNILSIDAFLAVVKKRPQFMVKELFPGFDQLSVSGSGGRFTSELVVPFVRKEPGPGQIAVGPRKTADSEVPRTFRPGSEWLFLKLYTGTSTADRVLRDVIGPLADTFRQQGLVDRWFFIRYGDPDWHLRLRFHGRPEVLLDQVFPALEQALAEQLDNRSIWNLQLDTYHREVERYGGSHGIVPSEALFEADSDAVITVLRNVPLSQLGDARWRLTLKAIDLMFDDLGFDLETRHNLMERASEAFAREFYFKDTPLRHQISKKFRTERRDLDQLLDPKRSAKHPLAPLFPIFQARSQRWKEGLDQLAALEDAGQLDLDRQEISLSYAHMTANRLLRSSARAQELLIYSFLFRIYDSRLARQRQRQRRG